MSKKNADEQLYLIFEAFNNGDEARARAELHEFFVNAARVTYTQLLEDEALDDQLPVYGGDPKADFADDIASPIDGDEDFEDSEYADDVEDEESVEDRVDELEDTLANLQAQFDALLGNDEVEDGVDFDGDGEIGDGTEEDVEDIESISLSEATEFLTKVPTPKNKDGQEFGGGKVAVNTTSPVAKHAPIKPKGTPVDFGKGSETAVKKAKAAQKIDDLDNCDIDLKKAPAVKTKASDDNAKSVIGSKKIR